MHYPWISVVSPCCYSACCVKSSGNLEGFQLRALLCINCMWNITITVCVSESVPKSCTGRVGACLISSDYRYTWWLYVLLRTVATPWCAYGTVNGEQGVLCVGMLIVSLSMLSMLSWHTALWHVLSMTWWHLGANFKSFCCRYRSDDSRVFSCRPWTLLIFFVLLVSFIRWFSVRFRTADLAGYPCSESFLCGRGGIAEIRRFVVTAVF